MNLFVDYLNSMNNADSNTIAALAESQVNSQYFEKIQIERHLGVYLSERIKSGENPAIVLTGHAGDGKTSILVQILRTLGFLPKGTFLKSEIECEGNGIKLYAVKDMSELPESKQIAFCRKALDAPKEGRASVIISNTGPLLKCLEAIREEQCAEQGISFDENERITLQTELLDQLDKNINKMISVGDRQFLMINMARIDNVGFARDIMNKLIAEELWVECKACSKCNKCPIYFNVVQIGKYRERVIAAVEAFYRYLYENDKRMTIRQILSQLSFALTGNLTCNEVKEVSSNAVKFKYLFSNLFFGYYGTESVDSADQIKGVEYAKELKLDVKGLSVDYDLFVKGDFSAFPTAIKDILYERYKLFEKNHINNDDNDNEFNQKDFEYRRSIRRAYIFFGEPQNNVRDNKYLPLYDELFGTGFNTFVRIQNNEASSSLLSDLRKTITDALYLEMTGTSSRLSKEIPLTLRRNDDSFQSVMITTSSLKKSNFRIEGTPLKNDFEDYTNNCEIDLLYGRDKCSRLSLPMVIYFGDIANGMISTLSNPSLTHGLSKLKAMLKKIAEQDNSQEVSVIINNTDTPIELKLTFDETLLIEDN